jgi:hypothetical protein
MMTPETEQATGYQGPRIIEKTYCASSDAGPSNHNVVPLMVADIHCNGRDNSVEKPLCKKCPHDSYVDI